jgi:hypothetical protein
MNRQVFPSMLLSVLIVCFFSVLLYERENSSGHGKTASPTTNPVAAPSQGEGVALPKAAAPANDSKESSSLAPARPDGEGPPAQTAPDGSAATRTPERVDPPPASPAAASPEPSPGESPSPRPVAQKPTETVKAAPAATPSAAAAPAGPRSAFTTVKEGESLEDVAIRVYGSADPVNSLWRANRDLLPQRTSPLQAGSILRTPEE